MGANLKDVAARAGVSVRTVSNVVNDFPLVAPETRARVRRAIDELRYKPNAAARNLRGGRTGLIGLIIPEIASPYFGEVAALLTRGAEERSWTLLVDQTDGDLERERRLLDGARQHVVDGVIVSPWALTPADLRDRPGDVPLVLLGEQDGDGVFDHVAVDNVAAARQATQHLVALGRSRIAAIGVQPHLHNGTAQQRLDGYRRALADAGRAADQRIEVPVRRLHRADGAAALRHLLEAGPVPDAIFCFNDQLALGAMRAATQLGLRVPDDLAVVGFDDIEDGRYATPSLTTIAPDKAAIADHALACLADRLGSGTAGGTGPAGGASGTGPAGGTAGRPARRITVGHRLAVRESTAGPAAPGAHPPTRA